MSVTHRRLPCDWLSDLERAELRRRVYELFDLRDSHAYLSDGSPYLRDGIDALVEWWYATEPDRLERAARFAEQLRPGQNTKRGR